MIPYNTKPLILYVISLDTILGGIIIWLQSLQHGFSNILSILLSLAGLVISYYTIINLKLKNRSHHLDNAIKEIDLKKKNGN